MFAPVAPAAPQLLCAPGELRPKGWSSAPVSALDTAEAFLFKSLLSEWHSLMTYRRYVMSWIPCGICCSLVVVWMLYDSTFCSFFSDIQLHTGSISPVLLRRGLSHHLPLAAWICSAWWLCVSQLGAPRGSSYLGLETVAQAGSARAGAPWRAAQSCPCAASALHVLPCPCCARGQSACSSHCHLPQTPVWHKPGASSSLSVLKTCLEIKDVRNKSLHLFSCSSECFPPQITHQLTFSGAENTFSYLQSPNVPIYFCTLAYLFPRLFLLIAPCLFLSVK